MQKDRFAAEQVDAPEAILHLTDEGKPRGAVASGGTWSEVLREHAANDIFVDIDSESMSNLLGDAHTAESGIAPPTDRCAWFRYLELTAANLVEFVRRFERT